MSALAFLSFQRVTGHRAPVAPSNEERVRAYRAYQPVQFANALLNDNLRAIEYARQACLEARFIDPEEYQDAL